MSESVNINLALLSSVFTAVQIVRYARLATVSITFFDYLTTLDQEIEHIWRSRWGVINVLFLANRYYALATSTISIFVFFNLDLTTPVEHNRTICRVLTDFLGFRCEEFFKWEGWTGLIFAIFGQVILQFRIYALYTGDKIKKPVIASMIAIFIISSSLCGWLMWRNVSLGVVITTPIPGGTSCLDAPQLPTSTIYAFWIPVIIFESLLCFLALLPAIRAFFEGKVYLGPTQSGQLIRILLRDSVLYFLVIFITAVGCLVSALVAKGAYLNVPVGFSVAMTSAIGSRLIWNIRDTTNRQRRFMNDSRPFSSEILVIPV